MGERDIEAIVRLRPALTNVIGFYELLYEQESKATPYQRMVHEVHFATSAHQRAVEPLATVNCILDRADE